MKMRILFVLACTLCTLVTPALAAEDTPESGVSQFPVAEESRTRAWLDLQRSGQQASAYKQPLSGPAMKEIYRGYVDSFGQRPPAMVEEHARSAN